MNQFMLPPTVHRLLFASPPISQKCFIVYFWDYYFEMTQVGSQYNFDLHLIFAKDVKIFFM
jgi:hypothetical protein